MAVTIPYHTYTGGWRRSLLDHVSPFSGQKSRGLLGQYVYHCQFMWPNFRASLPSSSHGTNTDKNCVSSFRFFSMFDATPLRVIPHVRPAASSVHDDRHSSLLIIGALLMVHIHQSLPVNLSVHYFHLHRDRFLFEISLVFFTSKKNLFIKFFPPFFFQIFFSLLYFSEKKII